MTTHQSIKATLDANRVLQSEIKTRLELVSCRKEKNKLNAARLIGMMISILDERDREQHPTHDEQSIHFYREFMTERNVEKEEYLSKLKRNPNAKIKPLPEMFFCLPFTFSCNKM